MEKKKILDKSINRIENEKSKAILEQGGFHSLIICGREHPLTLLQKFTPYLMSSGSFVVFSHYVEVSIIYYGI